MSQSPTDQLEGDPPVSAATGDQPDSSKQSESRPKTSRTEARGARVDTDEAPSSSDSGAEGPVEVDTHLRLWLPHDDALISRGYNNSDRNHSRRSLGSATDKVAEQRRIFGPWLKPDPNRQKSLVERLAPHKRPAPPDPKFSGWVNHFEYYQNIGIDFPKTRKGSASGSSSCRGGGGEVSLRNTTQYHRLLKRPRTTPGSLGPRGGDGSGDSMNDNNGRYCSASSARSSRTGVSVVSGLDRRYMGLQAVSCDQMTSIVSRLTKMTSAYQAKFAPNPHVWIDTAPGAHMVRKGAPV